MNNCGKLRFWNYFVDGKVLVENVLRENLWWIFWAVYAIFFFKGGISTQNLHQKFALRTLHLVFEGLCICIIFFCLCVFLLVIAITR